MKRFIVRFLSHFVSFNYKKYWRRRELFYNPKIGRLRKLYYKVYVYAVNSLMNADIPLFKKHSIFIEKPKENPHGLNGIAISGVATIGRNCFISHQVTIGRSMNGVPTIGDNCYIGPGAKIFGEIKIGNNVRIGANCPVFFDIPDNATVVLPKPRIIQREEWYEYYTLKE